MDQKLYTYEEYAELVDQEVRSFYVKCRLTASKDSAENRARLLDEWDQLFDDFAAERRAEMGQS